LRELRPWQGRRRHAGRRRVERPRRRGALDRTPAGRPLLGPVRRGRAVGRGPAGGHRQCRPLGYLFGARMSEDHHHPTPPSPIERRVAALEELLTQRGYVPEGFIEEVNRAYENDIGPMNGAKVVARAWTDPEYKARLLEDGTSAIAEMGNGGV